jgi:DNA-binding transcriptional ArsR family regulator
LKILNLEGAVGKRTKETPSRIQIENEHPRVFDRIFHNATARVLDFLILLRECDYTESEIARRTGLTPITVSKELETLVSENLAKKTRKIGRSHLYALNYAENIRGLIQYVDDTVKLNENASMT